jgi:hypothetical protein
MSFILNSFRFGVAFSAFYATVNGSGGAIADAGSINSGGTLTIPAAWNGRKVRLSGSYRAEAGAAVPLSITRVAGDVPGLPKSHVEANSSEEMLSIHSAPIVVATGDQFEIGSTGLNSGNGNAFGIQILPSGIKGCLAKRVTSGFSVGSAFTVVQWNSEEYDTSGYHDNTTNPSRMTVDGGTSGLIRLSASIELASAPGEIGITFYKNGSQISNMELDTETSVTNISAISPPITCVAGDYFEVAVRTGSAVNVIVSNNSWFAIEELPSGLNYSETTFSGVSLSSGSYVSVATRTVPSGVTLIRAGFYAVKSSTTGTIAGRVQKGATEIVEGAGSMSNSANSEFIHAYTVPFSVSPGDTISFYGNTNAGAQTAAGRFWIEEVQNNL